jgi:hypothetical protein
MSTQQVLNGITPYSGQSYATLAKVVDKAYVELSFWGTPYVYSQGYTGCVSLQELAEKVRALVDVNPHFSAEERAVGKIIQERVSILYAMSNDQYNRVGCIGSIVFVVIEYFTSRSLLLKGAVDKAQVFDYYPGAQFKEIYHRNPDENDDTTVCSQQNSFSGYTSVPIWRARKKPEKQDCLDHKKEEIQKNIEVALNGIVPYSKDSSYETFARIIDKAYVELSFWGDRCVYSAGYTGCVALQDVIEKVKTLPNAYPEFSAEERKMGKVIQYKVDVLTDISWDQVKRLRFIKSYIVSFLDCITKRTIALCDYSSLTPFNYYSAQQYRDTFGEEPGKTWTADRGLDYVKVKVWMGKDEFEKIKQTDSTK